MADQNSTMEFTARLRRQSQLVSDALEKLLEHQPMNSDLKTALEYTLSAPGKRVRPVLVLWCCELVAGHANRDAETASMAIEMVHTYSLVHDDLPAMDDDDMRRGLPTCHKAFDEATAILTGDALVTLAFEILSTRIDDPAVSVRLIRQLAQDAGADGMIGGQLADLKAERTVGTEETLEYIHVHKTAKMFRCAAAMGAICGGASQKQFDRLCSYGLNIGLAFQIVDDILDETASSEQLGKTAGKDLEAAKCTYPAVVGMDRAKELQKKLTRAAVNALEPFGAKADSLRQLATALLERTK
ncbi:MAG: polyprenyl synthetase family protein [Planctomycetota bacterium]|jgi:geranylgeranyl diphosphate synthase type II